MEVNEDLLNYMKTILQILVEYGSLLSFHEMPYILYKINFIKV